MSGSGRIVQCRKDTSWPLALDKLTDDSVVEDYCQSRLTLLISLTFDRCPLDLFTYIFLLLRLQSELDKDLLQLLVDVVNTELLETVVLEDFKTADYQLWKCPPNDLY